MTPFRKTLICLSLITVLLTACSTFLATSAPSIPTTTSMAIPNPTIMLEYTATPMPTSDMWEIQECRKAPNVIYLEDDWIWEYSGDIEGRGEWNMLLNFTKNNEILGFAFDSGEVREYKVSGCVNERNFTMWLRRGSTVDAVIQGEIPGTDPRGHLKTSSDEELKGDVITGSLSEKSRAGSFPVYLRLSSGTYGTMEHRFDLAGTKDDAVILNASQQFLGAIANNNRSQVVEILRFPVEVRVHDEELMDIQTPELFLAQYDTIFDIGFRERLSVTFPNYLRANAGKFVGTISQSIYGGGGIVFDAYGKVIAIYNWEKSELPPTPSDFDTPVPTPTLSADCGHTKLGTPGTQQLNDSNAPSILVQGTVLLCTNYSVPALATMFDLDTGKVDIDQADIEYEVPDGIFIYDLSSINGASSQYWSFYIRQQVMEPPQPTYDQCKQQYVDPHRMETETAYLCVITNEGHVSRVKVEDYSPILSVSWVKISFVTWNEVVVRP